MSVNERERPRQSMSCLLLRKLSKRMVAKLQDEVVLKPVDAVRGVQNSRFRLLALAEELLNR